MIGTIVRDGRTPLCLGTDVKGLEGRVSNGSHARVGADFPVGAAGLGAPRAAKIGLVGSLITLYYEGVDDRA